MYLAKSIIEGLRILGFDRETIKTVSKEKDMEEIFLSTLFLNYLIVLVLYFVIILGNGITIEGKEVNMPVLFGFLMIYPFLYNILIYGLYSLFGHVAEMFDKKDKVHNLLSTGFHTAIVYTILLYIVGLLTTFSISYGTLLFGVFLLWFLVVIFYSISVIYKFSFSKILMVLITPLLLLGVVVLLLLIAFPSMPREIIRIIFG